MDASEVDALRVQMWVDLQIIRAKVEASADNHCTEKAYDDTALRQPKPILSCLRRNTRHDVDPVGRSSRKIDGSSPRRFLAPALFGRHRTDDSSSSSLHLAS